MCENFTTTVFPGLMCPVLKLPARVAVCVTPLELLKATFVPAALFYCCLVWGGLTLAYVTVLGWMYGSEGGFRSSFGRMSPEVIDRQAEEQEYCGDDQVEELRGAAVGEDDWVGDDGDGG